MKRVTSILKPIMIGAAIYATSVLPAMAEMKATYLYKLSNFVGTIPYSSPRIFADKVRNEVYVLSGNAVSVFNTSGMEVYQSDYDQETGSTYDLAVDGEGNVITLNFNGKAITITLCNYRLEPQRTITLRNLPPEFAGFTPNQLKYNSGHLYLGSTGAMKVIVTDMNGEFIKGYDLVAMLGSDLDEKEKSRGRKRSDEQRRADNGLEGFNLDEEGNILFVLPVLGRAGRILTNGTVTLFGKRGNGHGKFGVPGGITADRAGNYLVSDKLRNVVIMFDKDLEYVMEFNAALTGPTVMDVDGDGKLYVALAGSRGVNVYRLVSS